MKKIAETTSKLIIAFILLLMVASQASAYTNTWTCNTYGTTTTCSGYQNGTYHTCTTTRYGNSSNTTCY